MITICEYNFEISGNQVKVFDTSLKEYVGEFESENVTEAICQKWLDEFYEF
jgi:hypothetical protein